VKTGVTVIFVFAVGVRFPDDVDPHDVSMSDKATMNSNVFFKATSRT